MNAESLKKYYIWGLKALVFAIPFLSLWIAYSMYFPYITGRNFAFRILVELALALWVALAFLDKKYRPKMTPIAWAVLAFTAVIGIADLLGSNPHLSFWSRLERMEGYLMVLHLAAYFFVTTNLFRTKKDWHTFFNLILVSGIGVGLYGIGQIAGVFKAIQGGGVRIDGTIGNPTYLAAYLTLVIATALILFFNAQKKWQKYYYGAVVAFELFVLFFTASRGAAFAFVVAVPLFSVLYLFFYRKAAGADLVFKRAVIGLLVFMIVVPAGIWLAKDTGFVKNNYILNRLTSLNFQERTIRSRFQIWGIAWNGFLERPVLGWGQENFLEVFSKYYDPRLYDQEPWFDRPHNIIFEWLINGGAVGLISYLALFGTLFWGTRKLLKKGFIDKKEGLVLIVMPVAYFLQNFFVFDNFNTYYLFFGFLAYVSSLVSEGEFGAVSDNQKMNAGTVATSQAVLASGLILALAVAYFINVRPMAEATGIITGLQMTADNTDPVGKAFGAFKSALSYNTFANSEALEQLTRTAGLLVNQPNIPDNVKIPFLQYAIQGMSGYLKQNPKDIRLHLMMGSLYQSLRNLNPQFSLLARDEIKTALDLSPNKQQILFLLADNYLSTGENEKALELLKKAVALEPAYTDAQVNLAIVGILAGHGDIVPGVLKDLNDARVAGQPALSRDFPTSNYLASVKRIAMVYIQVGKIGEARNLYNLMLSAEKEAAANNVDDPISSQAILSDLAAKINR